VGARFFGTGSRRHLAAAPFVSARFILARRVALALLTAALATIALAARADAYVYWAADPTDESGTPAIGRANLDGSNPNQTFITGAYWGQSGGPYGLAVDLAPDIEGNKYVYWTVLLEQGSNVFGAIGRATVDGTVVPQTPFMADVGFSPTDVAVRGGFIYWSQLPRTAVGLPGMIGRALSLRGDDPGNFIQPLQSPLGIAVDDTYIYWVDSVPLTEGATPVSTIGRARLDGTDMPNERWLVAAGASELWRDVAVDAKHVYWSNASIGSPAGRIGRARLNGSGPPTAVNEDWISGATNPYAVAVDAAHIYWSNYDFSTPASSIGSANLNATNVQQNLIALSSGVTVQGLAVDAGPFACAGKAATIAGTGRSDTLPGTNGDDVIAARGGDDTVSAGGGDDLVCGSAGNDVVRSGDQPDMLDGGTGNDVLSGARGNDRIVGGPGVDLLSGGVGKDVLRAADGTRDVVRCGAGRDRAVVDRKDSVSSSCERVLVAR
jgi:hypothetical protein